MRSDRPSLLLTFGAVAGLLFLHVPILIVFVYAFTTESATFTWPPPGFTTEWFARAADRADMWRALGLSLRVALFATGTALILGTLAAAAVSRARFFGRETVSLLVLLPIALPGITTAIALRSAFGMAGLPFSYWTIAIAHATFCIVVIYNNAVARFRRLGPNLTEAAMDLGAPPLRTCRLVTLGAMSRAMQLAWRSGTPASSSAARSCASREVAQPASASPAASSRGRARGTA